MQDQLNLLSQAKAGNKEARDLFLEKNTALVIHIAKRFSS